MLFSGEGEGGNKEGAMRGKRGSLALFLSPFLRLYIGGGGEGFDKNHGV